MVESTIQPDEIYIDKITGGRARLLCRWNIAQITRETDDGTQTLWKYEEAALWWTFPLVDNGLQLTTVDNVAAYVTANKEEIMNFAKGSKVSIA